jgi:Tfp pilus assembly protein PilF
VAEGRPHVVNGASISREQDMAHADQLLLEALERDRDQPKAYLALGRLRRLQNRLIDSKIELERAIALDRNNSTAILQLGITLIFLGQPETAVPRIEYALQLNPRVQNVWFGYFWLSANVSNWNASPQYAALREKTVDVGLRRAGFLEE